MVSLCSKWWVSRVRQTSIWFLGQSAYRCVTLAMTSLRLNFPFVDPPSCRIVEGVNRMHRCQQSALPVASLQQMEAVLYHKFKTIYEFLRILLFKKLAFSAKNELKKALGGSPDFLEYTVSSFSKRRENVQSPYILWQSPGFWTGESKATQHSRGKVSVGDAQMTKSWEASVRCVSGFCCLRFGDCLWNKERCYFFFWVITDKHKKNMWNVKYFTENIIDFDVELPSR